MSNKKATKHALLTSILAICLCLVMLIGSTFAWFTDTASTNVNSIQSGKLDVELVKAEANQSNEYEPLGEKLYWTQKVTAEGEAEPVTENAKPLWEPGCKYNLESFRIKNNGNLALKYKVVISGIVGNAELLKAIDFTVTVDGTALEAKDGTSTDTSAANLNNFEGKLAAGAVTGKITITGHMKEEAGNEYQDKSIDGITITVYATQDTVENDSYGNTYDAMAQYPVETISSVETKTDDAGNTFVKNAVVLESAATVKVSETETKPLATATVPADTKLEADTTSLKLVITETDEPEGFTVADGMSATTFDVKVIGVASDNTVGIPVEMYIDKGLSDVKLYHNGQEMTNFTYAAETGLLTFETATFSLFTVEYRLPTQVMTAEELMGAVKAGNTNIVLGDDITLSTALAINNAITIDLNGKTLSGTAQNTIKLNANADLTVKDSGESGKITNSYNGSTDAITVDLTVAGAKFTLLDGTIESNAKDDLYTLAIGNSKKKDCTVTIAGGTVAVPDNHVKSRAISASNGMMLNVTGGKVAGGLYGIDAYVGSTTTITGGEVSANAKDGRTDEYGKQYGIHAKDKASITVGSMDVDSVPTVQGIKFESNGPVTNLPTINLVKGNITSPIYSMEKSFNYKLFKLGIKANAPVTFADNTAQYFLPDGLQMVENDGVWTVTAQ